ncbi:PucR family transcriptional regulator [Streptomyces sp. NPDC050738]|uniref:PucR family transcriptional regulator n=1 Tax=Streptomyces sp. NPDC050738 TaxID=3154744 RepID=UPI003435FB04
MPDPASPPTSPVPLAALLARDGLGLRQLAGPPDAEVHWVHTSEMADPYPYLLGGELLLTAGVQLSDPDLYVSRIVQAGGAALGFGVTPVYDTVPPALVTACDRHGLALVEVPPPTPFTAIARAVWSLMAQARHRELRRVTEAQQGLAAAAARPAPIPAVLRQLASRLGGWAGLVGADGSVPYEAGPAPTAGVRVSLMALAEVVRPVEAGEIHPHPTPAGPHPTSATDTTAGIHLTAYALPGDTTLCVATPHREPGDHTVAGVAVVLLSLLTAERQGADEAARSSALVRMLLGEEAATVAPTLGDAPWTVVHARGDGPPPALGSPLADVRQQTVRFLLPAGQEAAPHPGWTLGISAPADPGDLPAADAQAARALRRAEATRTALVRHRTSGLAALTDPDEAAAYARTLLAPLGEGPLPGTLRTWLSLHGSWDRTAVALAVHRNTVRQRIARCAALLDADLDDMDVRAELWFALRSAEAHPGHSGQKE